MATPAEPSASGTRERSTRQFQAVLEELERTADFRSAQDIHASMRASGASAGLATVYRASPPSPRRTSARPESTSVCRARYRSCGDTHHHHLVCRRCGKAVEVQGPAVERWADQMASSHGFVDVSHTVELFGTCAECHAGRSS